MGEVSRQQVASFLRIGWYVSSLLLRIASRVLPGHLQGKVCGGLLLLCREKGGESSEQFFFFDRLGKQLRVFAKNVLF
jgi:hypothetical protein